MENNFWNTILTGGETGTTYNLMGIDENSIASIQNALGQYYGKVMDVIKKITTTETDVSVAFKGQAQVTTVENYLLGAMRVLNNVTAELNKFDAALNVVKTNYDNQTSNITVTQLEEDANLNTISTGVSGFGD